MYYNHVAHSQSEQHLASEETLAELYQMSDAFILLSGEGFGLPTFEAMASGLPCILLNTAASAELGAEGRAELVEVSGSFTFTGRFLTQRPMPDINKTVEAMLKIFNDKRYRETITERGYDFATSYTWDRVVEEWHQMLLSYEIPFLKPLTLEVVA